jgi:orotidine-5'-phosphate decarboxylase
MMNLKDRIIVALDCDTRQEALRLVSQLCGRVGLFKIGSQLFASEGPDLVRDIIAMRERVFLDLKFHDIPNTVVKAALLTQKLGVSMITAHCSGGLKMMTSLMQGLSRFPQSQRPLVLGVTVLTSLECQDLKEVGLDLPVQDQVIRLAQLAQRAGLDGVVGSPAEVELLRLNLGNSIKIVTPGIRLGGSDRNDQRRIATPAAALKAGADYLVVGRPMTAAADPVATLEAILKDIRNEGGDTMGGM